MFCPVHHIGGRVEVPLEHLVAVLVTSEVMAGIEPKCVAMHVWSRVGAVLVRYDWIAGCSPAVFNLAVGFFCFLR